MASKDNVNTVAPGEDSSLAEKAEKRRQDESETASGLVSDGTELQDADTVNWDGPEDPSNPMNWPTSTKNAALIMISVITFLSPLTSSLVAPCTGSMMADFGSDNSYVATFIVSGYLIGYVFGPLVVAPLSELYGRRPLYLVCNFLFFIFNVACAVAPNPGSLIVFRIFAGIGGSCPLTLGAASIADMIALDKRGAAMAGFVLGPLLGPTVGPIAGGYLCQATTWRWSFWVLAIAGGVVAFAGLFVTRESYAPVILEHRAKRLRKQTNNSKLRSALDTGRSPKDLLSSAIIRPLKMLFFSPIILLLSLYMAVIYGYLYLLFTTFPQVFEVQYGFSAGASGLTYLGIGIGSLVGLVAAGAISDPLMRALRARNGGEAKPEYRLPPMVIAGLLIPAALFWYGWSDYRQYHWIVPILGTGLLGVGIVLLLMATTTYLVDAFTIYSASAMAANTVLRSIVGAFLPLAGPSLYSSLGLNWGNSLLGFIALAMVPIPFLFYFYGERIRTSKRFKVEF
ncbi:MFS general substrate transporter [Thozetella sp. PMI_491]|nr:MFS general substrate transporter [Thozetella sp. PMI_491]